MKMKKLSLLLVLGFSLFAGSCTKNFEEMNENPNAATDVPSENILTNAIIHSAVLFQGQGYDNIFFGMSLTYTSTWAQHFAKIQYIDEDKYEFRPIAIDNFWITGYSRILNDLQTIIDKSVKDNKPNMEAVGRIMKAYVFHNVTDLWGDVPYFNALKAATGGTQPTYDSQQAIYNDLFSELKKANGLIDASKDKFGSGDLIYGGDVAKWKKFANSLRLRLAMRVSKKDPGLAKAQVEEILTNTTAYPIFQSAADNAKMVHLAAQPYRHPFYEDKQTRDDHSISQTMVKVLNDRIDPRLSVFAEKAKSDGAYRGQPNGAASQPNIADISRIGALYRDNPTAPSYFMTYDELMFIIAEAAVNGYNTGASDAKSAYEGAITANMERNGITGAPVTLYLTGTKVNFVAAGDKAQLIAEQKWIALFGQGTEAFHEYRRTGFPSDIQPAVASVYPGMGVPLRFPYPAVEATTNSANLNVAKQGIVQEMFGKRVWWDVN